MSDIIVLYLVNLRFSLFGCNTVCMKGILSTGILKYGAQFNEDSQPILIELADMSVASKGGDRRKLEKGKEGFDTDAYSPPPPPPPPPPLLLLIHAQGSAILKRVGCLLIYLLLLIPIHTVQQDQKRPVPMDISD
jgi:hypothetical protein